MREMGGATRWVVVFLLVALGGTVHAQPLADYADAPDGMATFYPAGGTGLFPTLFATANSRVGAPGAHHLVTGQEWLGPMVSMTSDELDASDPADPDGVPNLVGADGFDDGLPPLPLFLVLTSLPPSASLSFEVSVAPAAPIMTRYVNVLIDWDRDGVWKDLPA